MVPAFWNDCTAFWLDFGGLVPLGSHTNQKKRVSEFLRNLGVKKRGPEPVFMISGVPLGVHFGSPGHLKCVKGRFLFSFVSGWVRKGVRSPILLQRPCVLQGCFSESCVLFESGTKVTPKM